MSIHSRIKSQSSTEADNETYFQELLQPSCKRNSSSKHAPSISTEVTQEQTWVSNKSTPTNKNLLTKKFMISERTRTLKKQNIELKKQLEKKKFNPKELYKTDVVKYMKQELLQQNKPAVSMYIEIFSIIDNAKKSIEWVLHQKDETLLKTLRSSLDSTCKSLKQIKFELESTISALIDEYEQKIKKLRENCDKNKEDPKKKESEIINMLIEKNIALTEKIDQLEKNAKTGKGGKSKEKLEEISWSPEILHNFEKFEKNETGKVKLTEPSPKQPLSLSLDLGQNFQLLNKR